ncbi:MAG: autotransporter-associated beta strand repeat-containing protein [Pirellulales bacterium]
MKCRHMRTATLFAATIFAAIIVTARDGQSGTISTWNGSTGDWNDATRWSTNPFYPNNGHGALEYDAVIGAGAVNLNTDVTLASLSLNGGALSGSGNLATGTLTLNGGTLSTTGTLSAATAVLTAGTLGRHLTLSGNANTIQNVGIGSGFTLTNPMGATLTATTGPGERETNGPGSFINQGSFIKNGGERYYASLPMNNDGVVQVQQGNLRLNATGTHTGTFAISAAGQLELSGAQTFQPTATISGPGGTHIISGMAILNSDVSGAHLRLSGGTLTGSGNLHPDAFFLDNGTLGRNLTLSGNANTIQNIGIGNGFTLTNPMGATLTATTGPGERETNGPGSFINQGSFIKNGGERYYASLPMNNDGVVQVQQGNLRLNATGTHTGTFAISAAGQLELSGAQTFQPTATISGPGGTHIISGMAILNSDVSGAHLRLSGGTLTGSGNLHPTQFFFDAGTLGRNLTLPTTAGNTIQNLAIGAGSTLMVPVGSTLTAVTGPGEKEGLGPGTLINEGTFIKTGSARYYASMPMNNDGDVQVLQNNLRLNNTGTHTGTFEVTNGAQLELAGTQTLQPSATVSGAGGLLVISGTATINSEVSTSFLRLVNGTLTGSGNLHPTQFFFDAGTLGRNLTLPTTAGNTIQNLAIGAGSTLMVPVGSTLTAVTGPGEKEGLGPGTLINEGTFIKTGSARYYASMPMNNDGDVQVLQNNLRLNNTGTHTGTFEVTNGAQLELAGTQTLQPSATVSGAGGLLVISGTATINSEVSTSFLRLVNGTLTGSGNLHPTLFVFNAGTLARDLTLPNTATHSLQSLGISNGFTLTNPLSTEVNVTSGTVTGPGSFANQGTITKTGAGTETFATFSNAPSGAVNVQAGTLALSGVGTQEGTFTVSNGATLTFGGQSTSETTLTTGTLITGAGKVNVAQGILNVPGGTSNDYAGGTTVGSGGRVNITGAGTGLSPATATIQSGGVVSIEAASNLLASQALAQLGGTLAVRNEFIPQAQIAPASSGTFGIDVLGFATTVDMSVLGNGSMSLGSSTTGTYTSNTLGPGAGDTYRLGGGGGTITLTQQNVLTGNRPVIIVGPGTVILPEPQDFIQGTTIQAGTAAVGSSGSLGVGPITFQGGGIRAEGGPVSLNNDVTWAGNATLSGSHDLTLNGPTQLTGNRTLTVTNTATTTISQGITENAAGRRLTKDGPGTLVLGGDNSFTGGLTVRGGTLILDSNQHYGGTTTVDSGSKLVVQGDMLGGGPVLVLGGATIQGEGTIAGLTTVGNGSTISPGFSPGAFALANGLAQQNGSHFAWELAALSTANPALDWDQIVLTGGQLSILSGAGLDLAFIESATAPNGGAPFWASPHRWNNILDLTGTATNPTGFVDFLINNSPWSQVGVFDTVAAQSGFGVDLVWNPVPEPSSWLLLFFGANALWIARLFPRQRRTARR